MINIVLGIVCLVVCIPIVACVTLEVYEFITDIYGDK